MNFENFSFACPSYNEGHRLENFIKSSCCIKGLNEIVIIDHRSTDNTQELLTNMKPFCKKNGIDLKWLYEKRDWQNGFMMADIRELSIKSCTNDIVFVQDADFIFGDGFNIMVKKAIKAFKNKKNIYFVSYSIPVIRGSVDMDNRGVIKSCKTCIMHMPIPRVVLKNSISCRQDHVNGRHYWIHPIDNEKRNKGHTVARCKNSIVSIDIKSKKRSDFRKTMTDFFEMARNNPKKYKNCTYMKWLNNHKIKKKENNNSNPVYDIVGEEFVI